MISVTNEDFQEYLPELTRYAEGLLKSKGWGNLNFTEIDQIAKDIVQNTYLEFHNMDKHIFVSSFHLFNILKLSLYWQYTKLFNMRVRQSQYNSLKFGKLEDIKEYVHPMNASECEEKEVVSDFINSLNDSQKFVLNGLLAGYSQVELAKDLNCSKQSVNGILKGIQNKYLGKTNSLKELRKMSIERPQKSVVQLSLNGIPIRTFESGKIAASELNLDGSGISMCCKKKRTTHGGYMWQYKD